MKDLTLLPKVRSALFEVATREPEAPRLWTFRAVMALFGVLLVWACVARLDMVSVAQGKLVPETYVKVVQPTAAGIIREILVKEGDHVTAGQVLIRMDPTESMADSAANRQALNHEHLQVRRLEAELEGRPLLMQESDDPQLFAKVLAQYAAHRRTQEATEAQGEAAKDRAIKQLAAAQEELRKLEKTVPQYRRSAEAYSTLASQNLVGALEAEDRQRQATEREQDLESQKAVVEGLRAAVVEAEKHLQWVRSANRSELQTALLEATSRFSQLEQADVKLDFRNRNLELRAPQDGVVKDLLTTTVGAVVQPGTVILNLVPVDEVLVAEVSVENEDIGFVHPGQPARIKLATYPFQRYGMLEGTVRTISADASQPEGQPERLAGLPAFRAIVALDAQALSTKGRSLSIASGMQVTAEIIEGKRTVIEYLLSPVRRVASEAGNER